MKIKTKEALSPSYKRNYKTRVSELEMFYFVFGKYVKGIYKGKIRQL